VRLNDYFPIGECPVCGKTVYSSVFWNSPKYRNPRIPTCSHAFDPYDIESITKEERRNILAMSRDIRALLKKGDERHDSMD